MQQIIEEICIWHEHTRIKIPEQGIILRNRDREECLVCNGYKTDCPRYVAFQKEWLMKQDTKPYEESHREYGK